MNDGLKIINSAYLDYLSYPALILDSKIPLTCRIIFIPTKFTLKCRIVIKNATNAATAIYSPTAHTTTEHSSKFAVFAVFLVAASKFATIAKRVHPSFLPSSYQFIGPSPHQQQVPKLSQHPGSESPSQHVQVMDSQLSLQSTQLSIPPPPPQQQLVVNPSSQSQDIRQSVAMPSYPNNQLDLSKQTTQPCPSHIAPNSHTGAVEQSNANEALQSLETMQVDQTGTRNSVDATDNNQKDDPSFNPTVNDEEDGGDHAINGAKGNVVTESMGIMNGEVNGSTGRKRKAKIDKIADVGDGTERGKRGRGRGRRGK
ncbi:hypothetical protein BC829DRAFT_422201 [Chytridium lagenaria]|nr:hypothetical protein BC829DRAFT_422201 [Chytridium lagenaria]